MRKQILIAALSLALAPMTFADPPDAAKTPPQSPDVPQVAPGGARSADMKTGDVLTNGSGGDKMANGANNMTPINVPQATADQEKHFIMDDSNVNNAEIKIGQLATQNGTNDMVKKYGQMLVDDHTKAEDQLKPIVQKYGVDISDQLDPVDQAVYDKLSKKQGMEFDMAFAFTMAGGHEEAILCNEYAAAHMPDSDVRDYANMVLPHLHEHEHMARMISNQFTGNQGNMAGNDMDNQARPAGSHMQGEGQQTPTPSNNGQTTPDMTK